jgi:hypothetical protein
MPVHDIRIYQGTYLETNADGLAIAIETRSPRGLLDREDPMTIEYPGFFDRVAPYGGLPASEVPPEVPGCIYCNGRPHDKRTSHFATAAS